MRSEPTPAVFVSGLRVAVVVSTYHSQITSKLADGAFAAFIEVGGVEENYLCIDVPGAWELPVVAQAIAKKDTCDAIIALGCIITGETTHDRVIASAIAKGLMEVALQWQHPVSMGVLTCQTLDQAKARAGGSCGNKGTDSMLAALATASALRGLE